MGSSQIAQRLEAAIDHGRGLGRPPAAGEAEALRESAGVPINALAFALGVDAKTVARWERGEAQPQNSVRRLAWTRVLGCLADMSSLSTADHSQAVA